jgi:hypothetical protein
VRIFYELGRKILPNFKSELNHRKIFRLQAWRNFVSESWKSDAEIYCRKTFSNCTKLYWKSLPDEPKFCDFYSLKKWFCESYKKNFSIWKFWTRLWRDCVFGKIPFFGINYCLIGKWFYPEFGWNYLSKLILKRRWKLRQIYQLQLKNKANWKN